MAIFVSLLLVLKMISCTFNDFLQDYDQKLSYWYFLAGWPSYIDPSMLQKAIFQRSKFVSTSF